MRLIPITTSENEPYILPIFLIEKRKVTRKVRQFEKLSDFFWSIQKRNLSSGVQWSMKAFFELRDKIASKEETHFLLGLWETNLLASPKISFWSFSWEDKFLTYILSKNPNDLLNKEWEERKQIIGTRQEESVKAYKDILTELKDLYSYGIYLQ